MPIRERPAETQRSEHWLRVAVNDFTDIFNKRIAESFGWTGSDPIRWLSPIKSDKYVEYFDQSFLDKLQVRTSQIANFWPPGGPRWDGLAKTKSGKVILIEAKAHIEEMVDYHSRASSASLTRINNSLEEAKMAFKANADASWESPFYQYANRLAHLYFLAGVEKVDAYLLFVYFVNAPDVPKPASIQQWEGAISLAHKCLGLGEHPFKSRIGNLIFTDEILYNKSQEPKTQCAPASR